MTWRKEKKNNKSRGVLGSQLFFLITLIIAVSFLFPLYKKTYNRKQIDKNINELKKEVLKEENKRVDFIEKIEAIKSDYSVEEYARLKRGLKKEGEEVIVVKKIEEIVEDREIKNPDKKRRDINTSSWFDYFFKKK